MHGEITRGELGKRLASRTVCSVLMDLYNTSQRWDKGGALIHKVKAAGFGAKSGVDNIKEGRTPINEDTTFDQMKVVDRQMYDSTIDFLYPFVQSGIYTP